MLLAEGNASVLDRLCASELLDLDGENYTIHDYLDWNPSADDVRKTRKERAKSGARGGKQKASKALANCQTFASADSKQKSAPSRTRPVPVPSLEKKDPDLEEKIESVASHYTSRHPEMHRQAEGGKGRVKIKTRLGQYTVEQLCEAIDGNADDSWHVDRRKHDLEYVLRDVEHVDQFIALKHNPSKPKPKTKWEQEQQAHDDEVERIWGDRANRSQA
jgi:hypothetical protein